MNRTTGQEQMLSVVVEPRVAPLHQRRRMSVTGALPGSLVTVRAETVRHDGPWHAQVSYLADADGRVDLDTEVPVSGDFRLADPMGLFWAQTPINDNAGHPSDEDVTKPLETTVTARMEEGTGYLRGPGALEPGLIPEARMGSTIVTQTLLTEGVSVSEIDEDGLVGRLYRPAGDGPFPTVIVLNGSGGGFADLRSAQFAACGIQALALGYFRVPGLSNYISRTPLEYFSQALDYAIRELEPAGGKPWVSGQSRGGELTLLLASIYPDRIAGIAPVVPSAFVHGAQGAADPAEGWDGPAWVLDGEPVEHLWNNNSGVEWYPWDGAAPPNRHADVFMDGLSDTELARESLIRIENFPGPVVTVSGTDDRAWPSSMASRMVMDTLERNGHTGARLLLDYRNAGHSIGVPFMPATRIAVTHPVSGSRFSNGGTPSDNAHACEDSFHRVCTFIIDHTDNNEWRQQ